VCLVLSRAPWQTVGMPIYEYRCAACSERFEELVRRPDDTVACPECGGTQAERLLSTFAGVGGGGAPAPDYSRLSHHRNAGGCCGGACGHRH
jgi:putative FmdB family regulatory protein